MPSRMENFGFWLSRTFASTKARQKAWPYVPGTYFVVDSRAPVAVTTLGSVELADEISKSPPDGLCIVGKVETENIGIEKIIKNILSNPAIRFLICAGKEPPKHLTGATMVAIFENGMDDAHRVPGSPGMRPVLPNTSAAEVDAFRQQVTPVDMIGCTDVDAIHAKVSELVQQLNEQPAFEFRPPAGLAEAGQIQRVTATGTDPKRIELDKTGYFVIHIEESGMLVEHYDYKERLVRIVEGDDARSIYLTLIRNGWVFTLDHAAYLGKELTRAELGQQCGFKFVQDGA